MAASCRIRPAGIDEMEAVREMMLAYQQGLGIDLCFQGFAEELAGLPGRYGPPGGAILVAEAEDGALAGMVGMRALTPDICEMKRLFVRPAHRGTGLGKALAEAILEAASAKGYGSMRLDSLESMTEAIALYRRLGFQAIEPYTANPFPNAVYLEKSLNTPRIP